MPPLGYYLGFLATSPPIGQALPADALERLKVLAGLVVVVEVGCAEVAHSRSPMTQLSGKGLGVSSI